MQLVILESLFEKSNFGVVTALNGQEAYEEALNSNKDDNQSFDIILLDLNMPVTDGYEACRKIIRLFQFNMIRSSSRKISVDGRIK